MKRARIHWLHHGILIPACLIVIFPIFWIFMTSIKPEELVFTDKLELFPARITLDNYRHILTMNDGIFFTWLSNSIMIAAAATFFGVFFAATTAFAFSRFNFYGKKPLMYAFLVTQMFPGAILIVPLYNLMRTYGLLNSFAGLILVYSTVSLPFCVWMLKGFFDTIPKEIDEAAIVDGLGIVGLFYRIILPLSLPGIAVTSFFSMVTAWNEFMFALTFMSTEKLYTLPVGLRTFVYQFNTDWHYMAAGAILVTLPVLFFFLNAQKYLVTGLMAGGVEK